MGSQVERITLNKEKMGLMYYMWSCFLLLCYHTLILLAVTVKKRLENTNQVVSTHFKIQMEP